MIFTWDGIACPCELSTLNLPATTGTRIGANNLRPMGLYAITVNCKKDMKIYIILELIAI